MFPPLFQSLSLVYRIDKAYNAALMEYIYPGESLKKLVKSGKDDRATEIICEIIHELRFQNEINYSFKHISELANDLSILIGHNDWINFGSAVYV